MVNFSLNRYFDIIKWSTLMLIIFGWLISVLKSFWSIMIIHDIIGQYNQEQGLDPFKKIIGDELKNNAQIKLEEIKV